MHIVVLGAGLAGITTAYQLLLDGHSVTVVDREAAPAGFTSYANAGLIAPGHAYAWGSPAAPGTSSPPRRPVWCTGIPAGCRGW